MVSSNSWLAERKTLKTVKWLSWSNSHCRYEKLGLWMVILKSWMLSLSYNQHVWLLGLSLQGWPQVHLFVVLSGFLHTDAEYTHIFQAFEFSLHFNGYWHSCVPLFHFSVSWYSVFCDIPQNMGSHTTLCCILDTWTLFLFLSFWQNMQVTEFSTLQKPVSVVSTHFGWLMDGACFRHLAVKTLNVLRVYWCRVAVFIITHWDPL